MNLSIARSLPVTLIGGADFILADLTAALSVAPDVVAADGGAEAARGAGLRPLAVVGDMDSITPEARLAFADVLVEVAEQDTTDFEKALRHIAAPLVIALGFSGGRLDHELAALHGLVRHPGRRCILVGPQSITFLCPPSFEIGLAPDTIVSLFPMGACGVASDGLRWPTRGLAFAPDRQIGTSNAATGGAVVLTADLPLMLVILPKAVLTAAVSALMTAPRWL